MVVVIDLSLVPDEWKLVTLTVISRLMAACAKKLALYIQRNGAQ